MVDAVHSRSDATRFAGYFTTLVSVLYVALVLLLYRDTVLSMVAIWNRSDTYAHGYLIVPISLWLIWGKREELSQLAANSTIWPCLLLVPGGFVWLLARMVDVLVVQQLALVGIVIVGLWAIWGQPIARRLAFPLGFLLLAVPMGEDLVPPMMELTATSTVWLVKLSGIPVYREGLYFTMPSGSWSVVEACSGVRYLIASFTLGLLYAHLTYRSFGKQLLFVIASILVPVLANCARAYIIVMLGHLSNMTIATGVDHLVYGWVFFGLVMMLLFWLGSFWRDDEGVSRDPVRHGGESTATNAKRDILAVAVLSVALAALWPMLASAIENRPTNTSELEILPPGPAGGWIMKADRAWDWEPRDRGSDHSLVQFYQRDDDLVALYLQQHLRSGEGGELVSGKTDEMIDEEGAWRVAEARNFPATINGGDAVVREVRVGAGSRGLLLWYWYRIGGHNTVNRYAAKAYQALEAITFDRQDSGLVLVATELGVGEGAMEQARQTLEAFLADQSSAINESLDAVFRRSLDD
jgi:exosortase A